MLRSCGSLNLQKPTAISPNPEPHVGRMDGKRSLPLGKRTEPRKRKDAPVTKDPKTRPQDGRPTTTTTTTSRSTKRVKFQDARNIRTQPSDAALEDGKLDLQKFLNARQFEIKALENSMRKCKAINATRVFQQVPRAMRRRTASHNAKRVPKRLREQAKREMREDNTPTVEARKRRPRTTRARIRAETAKKLGILAARKRKKLLEKATAEGNSAAGGEKPTVHTRLARPKIRRDMLNEPPKAESKFRKRQMNKTWLPTHLWHAKRATMTEPSKPLWRFAVPLTPTEKCYRPTHRASGQKGVVVWDMSYMSTIGLYGTADGAERVLKGLGLTQESAWGARGQKWRAGVRKWTGILSKPTKDSRRDIGPATIVWNPQAPAQGDDVTDSNRPKKPQRQLFIRTHPSCFLELFQELLKLAKMQNPRLHIEDLRFEIGSIELTGPASTEALLGVLQPYRGKSNNQEPHGQVFQSLAGVANPASLPRDALLAFSVQDPRLTYPPKRVNIPDGRADGPLVETLTKWPVEEGLKPFDIFSRDRRFQASQLPSQKTINRRRGANPPGETLQVTAADPPIPIMLLASRPSTDGQAQGTWTLLAPWKCIMALWGSLMHCPLSTGGNPRLGGLNEQRQIAFEHGAPWFPGDFPATDAGRNWELEQRVKRKRDWDRRPKGKRVEWKSLDLGASRKGETGDGLACDFEHLFAFSQATNLSIPDATEMDIDPPERSGEAEPVEVPDPSATALGLIRRLPKPAFISLLGLPNPAKPPANTIVTIHLTFVARGVANNCARIYRLPSRKPARIADPSDEVEVLASDPTSTNSPGSLPRDLRDQWLRGLPNPKNRGSDRRSRLVGPPQMPPGIDMESRKKLLAQSLVATELPYPRPAANELDVGGHHPLCPDTEDLLGFVTTGAFSLSEGRGTAIGSISAAKALESVAEAGTKEGKLCIVRNAGENVGWLARWELV
ncbi:ribonucleases P/MRP protein subunit POP1-domain-containing protein [Chaetomium fimeti]|uniref:Ribonucleases P/MRP protein subunit POP1-domain-containing protein n=1 Tax=Chaetomium fimeti TaxID=1854472 RepID=A0AAE0HKY6_9PEZI|nr:ribonucleases P/MRP protein subunit POP1-domain-containing protein [Chaetomium fimeti]